MHALVSILDDQHNARVEALWDKLASRCGLTSIRVTPIPHYSYHIAETYVFKTLEPALRQIAAETAPFTVRAAGLGVFAGPDPVLYIPVVKDENLLRLHARLWAETAQFGKRIVSYYAPARWVPHITLAHGGLTQAALACAMENLAFMPLDWQIEIDNLALVYQEQDGIGQLRTRFHLAGAGGSNSQYECS